MVADLPALAERMAAALAALDSGEEQLEALDRAAAEAQGPLRQARRGAQREAAEGGAPPREGGDGRTAGAQARPRRVHGGGRVRSRTRRSEFGIDTVGFDVRTNPGTQPGPLMKIASGGELARFLLALKVALADRGSAPTLVFDEIDTAVGGAVADAIGARLARLAARRPGALRHPRAAGRGPRRRASPRRQGPEGPRHRHRRHPPRRGRAGARRSPACSPARPSPTRPAPPPTG